MKKAQQIVTLIALGLLIDSGLHAQNAVNSAGGDASGSGGKASYSVGQVACQFISANSGSVTEGVMQSFEIYIINSIEEGKSINLKISEYPNPADNYIILKIDDGFNLITNSLHYQLYDMSGQLIIKGIFNKSETMLDIKNLKSASYFLKITNSTKEIKTFKIIKK